MMANYGGSTPDDPDWEHSARTHGVTVLDAARAPFTR